MPSASVKTGGFNDEMRRAPSQTPESRNNSYSSPLWPERMFKVCVEFALCILFAIWLMCRPTPLSAPKNATNFPTRDVSRQASCRNSQFHTRCCDALRRQIETTQVFLRFRLHCGLSSLVGMERDARSHPLIMCLLLDVAQTMGVTLSRQQLVALWTVS